MVKLSKSKYTERRETMLFGSFSAARSVAEMPVAPVAEVLTSPVAAVSSVVRVLPQAVSNAISSAGRRTFFILDPSFLVGWVGISSIAWERAPRGLANLSGRLAGQGLADPAVGRNSRKRATTRASGSIKDHASIGREARRFYTGLIG